MANRSYLNAEDEIDELGLGDLKPYSSISSRPPLEDLEDDAKLDAESQGVDVAAPEVSSPSSLVRDFMAKNRGAPAKIDYAADPLMKRFDEQQGELDRARDYQKDRNLLTNLGLAGAQAARGASAPLPNTDLYKNMQTQDEQAVENKGKDLDRRQRVINAIENRSARQSAASSAAADRRLAREAIQSNRDTIRGDKQAAQSRLTEKQSGEVQDFDNSIDSMKSIVNQLGENSGWTGPIDGRIADALVGPDEVAFRSELGRMVDKYRKLITGAGASNQELKKLEGRLPQPTDTFANFQAKAKNFIESVERERGNFTKNLGAQGKNVAPFMTAKTEKSSGFPKQVKNQNGKVATVSSQDELDEANSEGFN